MEAQQIQAAKSQQALLHQKQFSEDAQKLPYADNHNGEFVLFQSSPQPNNQGANAGQHNQNQALYTDPRGKVANSTIGVDEHVNDFVNLNNKRLSGDINQMTPQQDGKAHPQANDRARLKG